MRTKLDLPTIVFLIRSYIQGKLTQHAATRIENARRNIQAHAHRYTPGVTNIRHSWQAMRLAVNYEASLPRCHVKGHANRYVLGYTS